MPDDDAARLLAASPTQAETSIDVTAPAEHLYFGVTNHLHVGGDVLAKMNLNAGAQVELEVATADSSPLRFELWQVHASTAGETPWIELLNAFDTQSGFVLTPLYAPSDGIYLVHFPAPALPRDVNLRMDCDRTTGRCTAELQPGEVCYEEAACSPGLACAPSDGACDPVWWGGTCVVPGDDTACEGLPSAPVCGCDGTDLRKLVPRGRLGQRNEDERRVRGDAPTGVSSVRYPVQAVPIRRRSPVASLVSA